MIEASVSAVLATIAAGAALFSRVNSRINETDRRVDMVELRIAEKYVKREELSHALAEFKEHMLRIEDKLDQIAQKTYKS
tara:strand:+ start:12 stop:251 length:240 start_codon:yes stop_codon:yes gene_type:complete